MSSSLIDHLHPVVKAPVLLWLQDCWAKMLFPHIYCSVRSLEEQAKLYRFNRPFVAIEAQYFKLKRMGLLDAADALYAVGPQGEASGAKKTWAPPSMSFHQPHVYGGHQGAFAIDFVMLVDGKADWKDLTLYEGAAELAEQRGLSWSGRWKTKREFCHIQFDDRGRIKIARLARGRYA